MTFHFPPDNLKLDRVPDDAAANDVSVAEVCNASPGASTAVEEFRPKFTRSASGPAYLVLFRLLSGRIHRAAFHCQSN